MELTVLVENEARVICGLTDETTCQDVIYALAHATGKVGRFVLIEKWRTSDRSLAPQDKPLKILAKWGDYSSDVQFVLKCVSLGEEPATCPQKPSTNPSNYSLSPPAIGRRFLTPQNDNPGVKSPESLRKHVVCVQGETQGRENYSSTPPSMRSFSPPTKTAFEHSNNSKQYYVDTKSPIPESGTLPTSPKHMRSGSNPETGLYSPTTAVASNRVESGQCSAEAGRVALIKQLHSIAPSPSMSQGKRGRPPPYATATSPGLKHRPPPPSYERAIALNVQKGLEGLPKHMSVPLIRKGGMGGPNHQRSTSGSPYLARVRSQQASPGMTSKWGSSDDLIKVINNQVLMLQEQEHRFATLDSEARHVSDNECMLQQEIETMGKEINNLEAEARYYQSEIEKTGGSAVLSSKLEEAKVYDSQLNSDIASLQEKLGESRNLLSAKKAEIDLFEAILADLRPGVEPALPITCDDLEKEMTTLRNELDQMDAESVETSKTLDETNAEISKIEEVISRKKSRLEELASKIKSTTNQCLLMPPTGLTETPNKEYQEPAEVNTTKTKNNKNQGPDSPSDAPTKVWL